MKAETYQEHKIAMYSYSVGAATAKRIYCQLGISLIREGLSTEEVIATLQAGIQEATDELKVIGYGDD